MPTSAPVKRVPFPGYTPFAVGIMLYAFTSGVLILIQGAFASATIAGTFPGWQGKAYAAAELATSAIVLSGMWQQYKRPLSPVPGFTRERAGMIVFTVVAAVLTLAAVRRGFQLPPNPGDPPFSDPILVQHAVTAALAPLAYTCSAFYRQWYIGKVLAEWRDAVVKANDPSSR